MAETSPSPKAILRGHKAQIHAATFIRGTDRLVTGDAEGYVVVWDLTIMRPRAVWRAHENAILRVRGWGNDKIISHGRDHKLIVWKVGQEDEANLSTTLPVEDVPTPRAQPWILYLLEVNTMNFCSFSACANSSGNFNTSSEILLAVPNTLASESIDIYHLPSQSRLHTIKSGEKSGMAMCLELFHYEEALTLIAAFEDGYAMIHRLNPDGQWIATYRAQAHTQPVLSMDVHPNYEYFITSSADSIIAKHPIPKIPQEVTLQPESTERVVEIVDPPTNQGQSLLSAALKGSPAPGGSPIIRTWREWKDPLKQVNTKHSGQQSLQIRSDGRILATAGWDSTVRIYSTKTLKELAVLKWHQVGCYAVAFSDISGPSDTSEDRRIVQDIAPSESASPKALTTVSKTTSIVAKGSTSVKERRIQQVKTAHWVAAGAKDGKISLWDIY